MPSKFSAPRAAAFLTSRDFSRLTSFVPAEAGNGTLGDRMLSDILNRSLFDLSPLALPNHPKATSLAETTPDATASAAEEGAIARASGGGEIEGYLPSANGNTTDGGSFELDGVSSITSAHVGGFTYVFVAGADDDGISVFRLSSNGSLTPVTDVTDAGTFELDGARGLSTALVDGNTYLFAAGAVDDGVSAFRVNPNGSLTAVSDFTDDATLELDGAADTASVRVGNTTFLFVAGEADDGISTFRVGGDGRLYSIANTSDGGALELDGVRTLATVMIGATAYLIAGGGVDDGVSVFSVAANGSLTNVHNSVDAGGNSLNGVSDIVTTTISGTTFVYVSGADDNGVTAFTMSAGGVLSQIDNEVDGAGSLIAGAQSLSITTIGSIQYLMVGGSENGFSLYRIENGSNNSAVGSLTWVENVADAGNYELQGNTHVHGASIYGTQLLIGGGSVDDGISTFGHDPLFQNNATQTGFGQIWYSAEGNNGDARIGYFNSNGGNHFVLVDNTPSIDLTTGFVEALAIDSAAGFYFALVTGNEGLNARLVRGQIGSSAAPTVIYTFDPNFVINSEDNLAFHIDIDTINERLYFGYVEFNAENGADTFGPATQGVLQFTYHPLTGAVTGTNSSFLVTQATANIPASTAGATAIFAARDMTFDTTRNVFYTSSLALGDNFETNIVSRFSLSNPTGAASVSVVSAAFFAMNGNGSDFTTTNGIVADIEVDEDSNRLYILARSEDVEESGVEDSLYVVFNASTASNVTPTEVTLSTGNFTFTLANFYPGDMTLDEVNNILYIESENSNLVGGGNTDVILAFQLNAAGTAATLINVINMGFTGSAPNIESLQFNYSAALSNLTATGTAAVEQASLGTDLLASAPTITDFDGDHLSSATIQITGGFFNSNQNSYGTDLLGLGTAITQSGTIGGTNITVSWNAATGTLTLIGYDTFANYAAALNNVHFRATGDNPTNFGLNTFRTITWTISDGLPNIPGGQVNSGATTVNITAVNDSIVNNGISNRTTAEDTPLSITGLSITDPDLNPAITDITVTLNVTNGTLTLLTNVAGGLTASDITNNGGTGLITITATLNEINATLAATNGLVFTNTPDFNGNATIQIASSDGGNTGTGGVSTATDTINITITAVQDAFNDTATTNEDTAVNIPVFGNDTFEASNEAITAFTQGANGTVTLNNNGTAGDTTDDFLVYTANADFNGTDSFTYTVTSGGVTEQATVNVTINAIQDAFNDTATTNEDNAVNVLVFANDSFEATNEAITAFSQGANGTVALNNNGTAGDTTDDFLVYTPNANFFGNDGFTYTITSGGVTEQATVSVTINPINDEPTLGATALNPTFTENGAAVDLFSAVTASTLEAGQTFASMTLTVTNVTDGAAEILFFNGSNIALTNGNVVTTATNGLNVTVSVAANVATLTFSGAALSAAQLQTLIDSMTYRNTSEAPTDANRVVTITQLVDSGSNAAPNDNTAALNLSSTVNVNPVDDAGTPGADSATVAENGTAILTVLTNDSDIDGPAPSVAQINGAAVAVGGSVILASGARVTRNADGTLTYDTNGAFEATPAAGSGASNTPGNDSFTYTLAGGGTATVTMTITGIDNRDILLGTAGNDVLIGGADADRMEGGAGADFYFVDQAGDVVIELINEGADQVFAGSSWTLGAGSYVEAISTTDHAGTDAISLTGNALSQTLYGNDGANVLDGGGGGDVMIGRGGDDIYYIRNAADRVYDEAESGGIDRVYASVSWTMNAGARIEFLSTTDAAGTLAIDLKGSEVRQVIAGNEGANRLDGGYGSDTITGGGGADIFAFTTTMGSDNADLITDFLQGVDKLGFAGVTQAQLAAGALRIGTQAGDADDRIIYDPTSGGLYFDSDGNGAAAQVQFAIIQPGLTLTSNDFVTI